MSESQIIKASELMALPARKAVRCVLEELRNERRTVPVKRRPLERMRFWLVIDLHAEILNGGVSQYFTNSYGRDYQAAMIALEDVGANEQLKIIKAWLNIIPDGTDPADCVAMQDLVSASEAIREASRALTEQYARALDSFYSVVRLYIVQHYYAFDCVV